MAQPSLKEVHDTIQLPIFSEARDWGGGSLQQFQNYINCFPITVQNNVTGSREVQIAKRAPLTATTLNMFSTTGASVVSTLYPKANITITQLNDVYVCALFDSAASKIYIMQYRPETATVVKIGEIASTNKQDFIHITECQLVDSGTIYAGIAVSWTKYDKSSSKGYWARSDGTKFTATTLTEIVAASWPVTLGKVITGPIQQLNGLFHVMATNGTIYTSGAATGIVNDLTQWNSLTTLLSYQSPDSGIGVYRFKHHLVAFGQDSIEFFNDIGNPSPATPLQRTDQAFIRFGALHSMGVINVEDTLYWISYGTGNTAGLWKLDGYSPVKISGPQEDALLHSAVEVSNQQLSYITLFSLSMNQRKHIGINSVPTHSRVELMTSGWGETTTDTYRYYQDLYKGTGGILIYNLTDNLWWSWSVMQNETIGMYPTASYPGRDNGDAYYEQYVLCSPLTETAALNSPSRIYVFGSQANGYYIDDDPDGSVGALPISVVVNLNPLEFNTLKRKRISRASLVFSQVPNWSSADAATANIYSINLLYQKNNVEQTSGSDITQRTMVYPNGQYRYYFNNLGMSRYWGFTVACLSKDSFGLKSIELEVSQNTH
jgi:hypothetical protein